MKLTTIRALVILLLALIPASLPAQDRWETLFDADGVRADLDLGHVDRSGEHPLVYLRWFAGGQDQEYTIERQELDCPGTRVRLREARRYRRGADGDRLLGETAFTPAWTRYPSGTVEARVLDATCQAISS